MKINEYSKGMRFLTSDEGDYSPNAPDIFVQEKPDYRMPSLEQGFADGGSVETPKRGLVDEPGSYAGRRAIPGVTSGVELKNPIDGKKFQIRTKNKTYLFKTEKQADDFYNKNIKKGSGAQIKDTFDKQSKELKEFFKDPKTYKRFYDGPLNASSIDKIWLNISAAQKRQAKQLLETQGKNIKEAYKLTKQGYIRVNDLADKLGRTTSLELVQSMKNSQKFKKLFPNYLDGMITSSNNTKWIKTTPSTLTKLKQWADDPLPSGLRDSTIKNVQTAFKDKKLIDYWKNWKPGTPIDQKLIDSVHGKKGSAYTMMQLGRTLQGKEPIEGVRKNVALGNKIIDAVRYKAKEFGDWHTAAYKYAKQDMDTFLPPGKSGTTFGDYQRLITKSLKDVGLEGFQVDEINALRSGVRGGTQPYSVFSQILEGKYNQGFKRRFDGENAKNQMKLNKALSMGNNETIRFRPKGSSNSLTMGKQDYIKYILKLQNDQVDDFFTKAPQLKGRVSLPKFDLRDPKTVYGSRFNTFDPALRNAISKNFKEVGYTVDVGKKALTQKELLKNLLKRSKPSGGVTLGSNFANVNKDLLDFRKLPGDVKNFADIAANLSKSPAGMKVLRNLTKAGKVTGYGLAAEAAFAAPFALSDYAGGKTGDRILGNATFGILGQTEQEEIKEAVGERGYATQTINELKDLIPRIKEQYKLFNDKNDPTFAQRDKFKKIHDINVKKYNEAYDNFVDDKGQFNNELYNQALNNYTAGMNQISKFDTMRAEERPDERTGLESYDVGLAGGGLLKQAGDRSGPALQSGPTPQGLDYLLKRGRQY